MRSGSYRREIGEVEGFKVVVPGGVSVFRTFLVGPLSPGVWGESPM